MKKLLLLCFAFAVVVIAAMRWQKKNQLHSTDRPPGISQPAPVSALESIDPI